MLTALYGSRDWWIATACRFWKSVDWCDCRTRRSGNASKTAVTDNFYQKVFPYRGAVSPKVEYWKCERYDCWFGWWCRVRCYWKTLLSSNIPEYTTSTMWATAGGAFTFKGSVTQGANDGWHVSWYGFENNAYA